MFDKFQLKFFNLDPRSNYNFLNNPPVTDKEQQAFLKESVASLEDMVSDLNFTMSNFSDFELIKITIIYKFKIKNQIDFYLQNKIQRILVDNMEFMPMNNSILVSFMVIIKPDVQDTDEASVLLSLFNSLITNQIGFDDLQFYNETMSSSSLLPKACYFSSN